MEDNKEINFEGEKIPRFVTRPQFRRLCSFGSEEIPKSTLASDITRGNVNEVVRDGHRLIDMQDLKNVLYFEEKKKFVEEKAVGLGRKIDAEKKRVDLEKSKEELRIKQINRMRREGELIPTDLATIVMKTHLTEVKQQFYYAAERISNDTVRKLGGTKTDMATMKGNLVKVLNQAIEKAKEGSLGKIESIKQEFNENG